jgi:hypothetical protein
MLVGFGSIFDNITLVRYNEDDSEQERFIVPIGYASKENYVDRLSDDPNLDKKTRITLPTMAYEMTGISYDTTRKQNTNIQNFAQTPTGIKSQYNPVPYDFNFSLYLYVRNIEDASQIIEHILAYFTPDFTLKINLIPEMGIIKEVPVLLKDVSQEIISEGDRSIDTRIIIWTLNFTAKGFIYGPTSSTSIIKTSITNILSNVNRDDVVIFNVTNSGTGTYKKDEIVYQGYSLNTSTATGKVVDFKTIGINKELYLTDVDGNFVSNQPIIGAKTNANYKFTSYYVTPYQYAKITVVPNPVTANANSNYTYTTTIKEY